MTEVYTYRAEIGSNWKLFIDAFAEFYHAPVLHQKQAVKGEADKLLGFGFEALHYELSGPHSMISSWGGMSPPKDPGMVKPIERVLRSGLFGPWERPDLDGLGQLPPGLNPARHRAWGMDSFFFFPNFMLLIWAPGWYLTYHYWPTAVDRHLFETSLYFVPPRQRARAAGPGDRRGDVQGVRPAGRRTRSRRPSRCWPAGRSPSSPWATRKSCSGTCTRWRVTTSRSTPMLPAEFAALEPYSDWILATEPERYAKRLASTMAQMQAFYDAAFPLLEPPWPISTRSRCHDLPEPERGLLHLMQSLVMVSFPGRGVETAPGARQRRRLPRPHHRTGGLTPKGLEAHGTSSGQGRVHHRRGARPGPQPRGAAGRGGRGHHRGRPVPGHRVDQVPAGRPG